jgi:hypothetical protein
MRDDEGTRVGRVISASKDAIALARDGLFLCLLLLLLFSPKRVNKVLTDAGFDHGSVMGLEWKARLTESTSALQSTHDGISELQAQNAKLAKALDDLRTKDADPSTEAKIAALTTTNAQLSVRATDMQAVAGHVLKENAPLVGSDAEIPAGNPSDYLVGLQTLGMPDSERVALNEQLAQAGYQLHQTSASYDANHPPSWFPRRSTVFYYSVSAVPAADRLARFLEGRTHQSFVTQLGSGSGVLPGQRAITLFVDYVKPTS